MSTGDNRRLLIFRYENQENQVKFKVKTFFKSLLFKNENQENRNDFIFWLNYTIYYSAALKIKTKPTSECGPRAENFFQSWSKCYLTHSRQHH